MFILAFDTSIHHGAIGWVHLDETTEGPVVKDLGQLYLPAKPGHAERLLDRIHLVLESGGRVPGDVDLLAIGAGPGTFTGLRIGFATAKALHLSCDLPIKAVSTLKLVALGARRTGTVVSVLDARRKEVYLGGFKVTEHNGTFWATSLMRERVIPPSRITEVVSTVAPGQAITFVGDGAVTYASHLVDAGTIHPVCSPWIDSTQLALTAYRDHTIHGPDSAALLEPVYLREPDARKPKTAFANDGQSHSN